MAISGYDNSFSLSIAKWIDKVDVNADAFTKKVVLEFDERFSKRSPVDTGRFKGNWMLGVDTIPTTYDKNKFDRENKVGENKVGSTVGERVLEMPTKGAAGHVYYLVNNLPYAKDLEQGSSKQTNNASGGVVYLTVLEYEQIVRKALEGLKK